MKNTQQPFCEEGVHRDQKVIWILDTKNPKFNKIKTSGLLFYTKTEKRFYLKLSAQARILAGLHKTELGKEAMSKIQPINLPHFKNFSDELKLKGYSPNTYRTYCNEFAQLLALLKDYPVDQLSEKKLRSYFLYCHEKLMLSENSIHSRINAIKFYFNEVLKRPKMFVEIPRPSKQSKLPKVLNVDEIKKMFAVTENLKHLLILKLSYGMGLRVSEIVNLKIQDVDMVAKSVLIQNAKGKKDRYVNLPETIAEDLQKYLSIYEPKNYFFEGTQAEQYSKRSAQNVFKNAMNKAGIQKNVGIHSLRHSYATHLLEYGTDISLIQKLLGHQNIKTTLVYTEIVDKHVKKVESPLDKLS